MTRRDEQDRFRSTIMAVADKVRHPDLPLSLFLDSDSAATADQESEEWDDESKWSDDERQMARLRRGALLVAAHDIIDECIDDLRRIDFPEEASAAPDEAEESFVYRFFPVRFRHDYDEDFFRKVLVIAVKVAQDLADPQGGAAACTAEAIIRAAVLATVHTVWEEAGVDGLTTGLLEHYLLEDIDFEFLFADENRGVENDPRLESGANLFEPGVDDWFVPFTDAALVHPYVESKSTGPMVHDLRHRLPAVNGQQHRPDRELNAPEPVVAVEAGSPAVARARRAADHTDPELWVPNDTDAEASFHALLATVSRAPGGSGWLTWQPFDGNDTIRTDLVMRATPYRHFPVGPDEPWIDATVGQARLLAIPLRYVVSYRPDPDLRSHVEQDSPFPMIPLPPEDPT